MPVILSTLRILLPSQSSPTAAAFLSTFSLFIFSFAYLDMCIIFFKMSQQEKSTKTHGGWRPGSGRKKGRTKEIRSITVDKQIWKSALEIWNGKASRLVERLLARYLKTPSLIPPKGAQ